MFLEIKAPTSGVVGDLAKIKDPVFSSKSMGDGIVIYPLFGDFYAPVNGEVEVLFPTGHAQIYNVGGVKVMMHIGIDTIILKGDGFKSAVTKGTKVVAGKTKVVEVDLAGIQKKVPSLITPIIIIEHENKKIKNLKIHKLKSGEVKKGMKIAIAEFDLE